MFYNENFKGVLKSLDKNIRKVISENRNTHYMFVVFGYTKLREHFKKMMEEEENKDLITIDNLILLAKESKTIHFTIIDSMNQLRSVDDYPWYNLVTLNNGIIISGEVDNQELFMIRDPYNNPNIGRDDAVVIENGDKKFIKFVNKKGDENG